MQGNFVSSISVIVTLVIVVASAAFAQESPAQPQAVAQSTPMPKVRVAQPTRTYRSYSVSPSNQTRGDVRRNGQHASDATWRHAGAKPVGHYNGGR
ncbi:MAG: hypothetical protein NTY87_08690 [Planctomycetia bacterium]|nr:hypothetical protein [Planctomycetia bacterium]